jgi:hypothetical protein
MRVRGGTRHRDPAHKPRMPDHGERYMTVDKEERLKVLLGKVALQVDVPKLVHRPDPT